MRLWQKLDSTATIMAADQSLINVDEIALSASASPRFQVLVGNTDVLELVLLQLPLRDLIIAARVCQEWHSVIADSPALQAELFLRSLPARYVAALSAEYQQKVEETLPEELDLQAMRCLLSLRSVPFKSVTGSKSNQQEKQIFEVEHDVICARDATVNPVFFDLFPESATPVSRFTSRHGYLQGTDPARKERIERNQAAAQIWNGKQQSRRQLITAQPDEFSGTDSPLFHLFTTKRDDTLRTLRDKALQPKWTRCPRLWRRMYATQPPSAAMTIATCKGWWGWEFSDIIEPDFEIYEYAGLDTAEQVDEKSSGDGSGIPRPRGVTVGTILDWLQRNEGKLRKGFIIASCPPKQRDVDV